MILNYCKFVNKGKKIIIAATCGLMLSTPTPVLFAEIVETKCEQPKKIEPVKREDVYKGMPFAPGEESTYDVSYFGVVVGAGTLSVLKPIMHKGQFVRVFSGEAKTADWYKYTYVVHDKIRAYSRPQDFAIQRFYLSQNEGTLLGSKFEQEKWLEFDHDACKVVEKTEQPKKEAKTEEFMINRGAIDTYGIVFYLRTRAFDKLNVVDRSLIYSSEKNWWLDAKPVAYEEVKVPVGKFKTVKLQLQTYIGKDLQQKGDVFVWIATDHPNRPIVKISADIKIGSLKMELTKFTPGN